MISTIIVDDEPKAVSMLQSTLKDLFPEIKISNTANSAEDAYHKILVEKPDLLFLDIAMPKESGFDLLRRLPDLNFEIIFVTGFDEYALEAVKFCAIGYVVKPIQDRDFFIAVQHAQKRILEKQENERNRQLLKNIMNPGNVKNRIGIPTETGIEFVSTDQIIRCEGVDGYTRVILEGKQDFLSSYNLGEFRKLLEEYGFYSTHKSHLVNTLHIKSFDRESILTMLNGDSVAVSRRKRQEFLDRIKRL